MIIITYSQNDFNIMALGMIQWNMLSFRKVIFFIPFPLFFFCCCYIWFVIFNYWFQFVNAAVPYFMVFRNWVWTCASNGPFSDLGHLNLFWVYIHSIAIEFPIISKSFGCFESLKLSLRCTVKRNVQLFLVLILHVLTNKENHL